MSNTYGRIRLRHAKLFYSLDNRIKTYVDVVTGYGPKTVEFEDNLFIGSIDNPTGMQPAVFYKTGVITGYVNDGSGYLNFESINITGSGELGQVYLNYATGYSPAYNIVEFADWSGCGLSIGDYISIENYSFRYYPREAYSPAYFTSPDEFINILNSGATGAYDYLGYSFLRTSVGVTGFRDDNKIHLFSSLRSGESGNQVQLAKYSSDIGAIKISGKYFFDGQTYRPPISEWTGDFENTFNNLKIENSGYYTKNLNPVADQDDISGVIWREVFSGNYRILTGLKDPNYPQLSVSSPVEFYADKNLFSGRATIPSGQIIYTGMNIQVLKNNFYNKTGGVVQYVISGDDFIFSGFLGGNSACLNDILMFDSEALNYLGEEIIF